MQEAVGGTLRNLKCADFFLFLSSQLLFDHSYCAGFFKVHPYDTGPLSDDTMIEMVRSRLDLFNK